MTITAAEEYFDLTYSDEPASYYTLIVEIGETTVKAAWYHRTKNLITGFARYPKEAGLEALIAQFKYLQSEFEEVLVLIDSNNYLIAPRSLGTEIDEKVFALTNSFDPESELLRTSTLVNLKSTVTIALDQVLDQDIHRAFRKVKVLPHVTPFIEHELNFLRGRIQKSGVFIHVHDETLDLRVYLNGKLHLSNSFFQSGKEDIAYFVLYASEILEIDPEKCALFLSGEIAIGDGTWLLLSNYWKSLSLVKPLTQIEVSDRLRDYPKPEFEYLTYALLCAS